MIQVIDYTEKSIAVIGDSKEYRDEFKKLNGMKNRLYDLPEELQRLIFKKTYDGVVQEIRDFLHADQPYVYRKPNMMNRADTTLFAFKFDCWREDWEFRSSEQYYNGNRQTHFLTFGYAFLYLKKHPTGVYERSGDQIEYVFSESEDESESGSE